MPEEDVSNVSAFVDAALPMVRVLVTVVLPVKLNVAPVPESERIPTPKL